MSVNRISSTLPPLTTALLPTPDCQFLEQSKPSTSTSVTPPVIGAKQVITFDDYEKKAESTTPESNTNGSSEYLSPRRSMVREINETAQPLNDMNLATFESARTAVSARTFKDNMGNIYNVTPFLLLTALSKANNKANVRVNINYANSTFSIDWIDNGSNDNDAILYKRMVTKPLSTGELDFFMILDKRLTLETFTSFGVSNFTVDDLIEKIDSALSETHEVTLSGQEAGIHKYSIEVLDADGLSSVQPLINHPRRDYLVERHPTDDKLIIAVVPWPSHKIPDGAKGQGRALTANDSETGNSVALERTLNALRQYIAQQRIEGFSRVRSLPASGIREFANWLALLILPVWRVAKHGWVATGSVSSERLPLDRVEPGAVVRVFKRMLDGLKVLHGLEKLHLDLKPQNICVVNHGKSLPYRISLVKVDNEAMFLPDSSDDDVILVHVANAGGSIIKKVLYLRNANGKLEEVNLEKFKSLSLYSQLPSIENVEELQRFIIKHERTLLATGVLRYKIGNRDADAVMIDFWDSKAITDDMKPGDTVRNGTPAYSVRWLVEECKKCSASSNTDNSRELLLGVMADNFAMILTLLNLAMGYQSHLMLVPPIIQGCKFEDVCLQNGLPLSTKEIRCKIGEDGILNLSVMYNGEVIYRKEVELDLFDGVELGLDGDEAYGDVEAKIREYVLNQIDRSDIGPPSTDLEKTISQLRVICKNHNDDIKSLHAFVDKYVKPEFKEQWLLLLSNPEEYYEKYATRLNPITNEREIKTVAELTSLSEMLIFPPTPEEAAMENRLNRVLSSLKESCSPEEVAELMQLWAEAVKPKPNEEESLLRSKFPSALRIRVASGSAANTV